MRDAECLSRTSSAPFSFVSKPGRQAYNLHRIRAGHEICALGLLLFLGSICLPPARASNLSPIAVTGFNRDLVIENTATGPPYNSAALEFNPGEGTAFYQSGLPGTSYGLPASGSFTSALGDGTMFQFQAYATNNALVFSSETGLTAGTLTLQTPDTFSRIAILANSASATATSIGTVTLNFDDGTTYVTNYSAFDWFNNPGFALQGVDRIKLATGVTSGGPSNPRFYQTTIDLAAALGTGNRPLASLTFTKASSANATAIYAISGLPTSAVTPPAVTNSPATNIFARTATLGGQVTDTGGETPALTLYYGKADGGTSPDAWPQNIALGRYAGAFSQTVSGLSPNTLYYFTAKAMNSGGLGWAVPSQSFTTALLTVPTITNLPATNVQATFATLNGQVLALGGELPTVTVYYGATDGRTTPSAWSQAVALGIQTGVFAQTVTGLLPNSSYYFTCSASNSAGTAWATASQTFTTQATDRPSSATAVLTHHNDNARTGMNLTESSLNTTNVNTNQFGLAFTRVVDDQVYAQPLVMTNVNILGRGTRNLVLVCTVNDSVYAFDADDASVTLPYWTRSFISPPEIVAPANTDMSAIGACGGRYQDFSGNMGIVGTPVIDPVTRTMYLVARTKEYGTNFVQRLHALEVTTGAERPYSPVIIAANYPGYGAGSVGGIIPFDARRQNQRPALALVNGIVYVSWSSHCDNGPYHGWVIGYEASTLQQTAAFNDTPDGYNGGIWMSGQGPAADESGNLYLSTGNGLVDTDGGPNRGESFLKLTPTGSTLAISSWFTPYNWQQLENGDIDLGSGGMLLIPGAPLAFSGGKQGLVYLVYRDAMGGLTTSTTTNDNVLQSFRVTSDEVHGGPVWWDGPGNSFAYIWPASTRLQQYVFDRGSNLFVLPALSQSPTAAPRGQPGGLLSLSANGASPGSGIVWAVHQLTGDANQSVRPGILHAYDAQDVSRELWNSQQMSARDAVGNFAKFVPPTVANGKVYLATFSGRLDVYGLLTYPPSILQQPQSATGYAGNPAAFTVSAGGTQPLSYQWNLNGHPLPGATSNVLILPSVGFVDAGPYSVVVTNSYGSALSSNADLAITAVGAAGDNSYGQLSVATGNSGAVAIAAGAWHSLILRVDGSITALGENYNGQCNVPTNLANVIGLAAGGYHSLALTFDGTVVGWGANDLLQAAPPPSLSNVTALAAGTWHSLALRSDGTVTGWGDNSAGQLDIPADLGNVVAIAAGGEHSLALRADGSVVAWGDNLDAFGSFVGQSVVPSGLSGVVAIGAGEYHSLGAMADGTVVCWGDNSQGQSAPPAGLVGVVALAGGGGHSVALKSDGTVVAWGNNWYGQCSLPPVTNAVAIAAGEDHTLLLLSTVSAYPQVLRMALRGTQFAVLLQTSSGRNYALEYKTSLDSALWQSAGTTRGSGTLQLLIDPNATGPQRFYRVRQW
jgi:hypothetical protein